MVDGPVRPLRFRHGDTSLVRCRVPRRCVTRILTLATMASPDQDPADQIDASRTAEAPRRPRTVAQQPDALSFIEKNHGRAPCKSGGSG